MLEQTGKAKSISNFSPPERNSPIRKWAFALFFSVAPCAAFGQARLDPQNGMASPLHLYGHANAIPIERSQLDRGYLGTARFPIARTPVPVENPLVPDAGQPGEIVPSPRTPLDQFLTSHSQVLHDRARAEAWQHFQAGDYRAAIRAFESAALLDDNDVESRIGEVFSYVALGSFR